MAPWNGSGDFSLSDTIAPATNADANELQAILTDIGTGIDASINADGQSNITGALKGADGTAALPSYAFAADLNSGLYRIGSDNVGLSLGGTKRWDFGTAASALTGNLSVTGTFDATSYVSPKVVLSADAGATVGPTVDLYRNSASPAASDFIGSVDFNGADSGAAKQLYAQVAAQITDPTAASEDAIIILRAVIAGSITDVLKSSATGITVPGALAVSGALDVSGTTTGVAITASGALSGATAAGAMLASQSDQETGTATNKLVQPGVQHFHPSAAKMWGSALVSAGTPSLQTGSFNITSITDTANGRLTVTIATDFSDTKWVCLPGLLASSTTTSVSIKASSLAAGSFEIDSTLTSNTLADPESWYWAGFGDQ